MRKYYEQVEVVLAEVTIRTRLLASSEEEAQRRFDEGEWDSRTEEVGDIRDTLRSSVSVA